MFDVNINKVMTNPWEALDFNINGCNYVVIKIEWEVRMGGRRKSTYLFYRHSSLVNDAVVIDGS